ncbi:MAG: DUF4943 family protein [Bacteroidota bacterium]
MRPYILALLVIGLMACQQAAEVKVKVEVRNQADEKAIPSAVLSLSRYVKAGPTLLVDTFLTDEKGQFLLSFVAEKGYQYKLEARKSFYEAALTNNGASYGHEANILPDETDSLVLYLQALLTASSNVKNPKQAVQSVQEVIGTLKANKWEGNSLPRLSWGDIPALLAVGPDSVVITNFPVSTTSRFSMDSARVGQVTLWMIEAIRRDYVRRGEDKPYFLMPPSNAPVLGTRRGNPRLFNSKAALQKAFDGYQKWWDSRNESDTLRSARKNPLGGTGLGWM